MDWNQLFSMQKQLDAYIATNHKLHSSDLFEKKILALFVELGELANETRCFKFWSTKPASERSVILEEYVDGLHFILSLGLDKGYQYESINTPSDTESLTTKFQQVYEKIIAFKQQPSKAIYHQLFFTYVELGSLLGFDEGSIQAAYEDKNKVNHERQDQGY
ncbi:dUTP diphosphatase [Radiobacillus sp. PE A8.2]|uniref:dUTP diphosphatase n=1 Tax=Radiobacillus sp. PE A8.2 TaxID=3380349 RepID=UPI0038907E4D